MQKRSIFASFAALLAVFLCLVFPSCAKEPLPEHYTAVLDVGQSDCILLSSEGKTMLIDTGSAAERGAVRRGLAALGVEKIDVLLLTHAHEDHVGNARAVIDRYRPEKLYLSPHAPKDMLLRLALFAAEENGVEILRVSEKETFTLGALECTLLFPCSDEKDENNSSVILRAALGETTLLYMGDAEEKEETVLLSACGEAFLDCDFLKVGHHGSATGTTAEFLAAATPDIAAVSVGKENSYGLPDKEALDALTAAGAAVYRTDEDGTLVFSFDGEGITEWKR